MTDAVPPPSTVPTATPTDTPPVAGMSTPNGEASMAELLTRSLEDVTSLFRQELELAKAELREEVGKAREEIAKAQVQAKQAGQAAGKLGAAGVLGHLALLLVTFAAAWGLAEVIHIALAFAVVAVVVGLIGFVIYRAGRKQLDAVSFDNLNFSRISLKPDQAIDELKETKQWAKQQ